MKFVVVLIIESDNMGLPFLAWCPSIQSAGCGGCRTGPALDSPALVECLWRASWLSEAGGVPVLAFSQIAAHTTPYRMRTCPPAGSDDKRRKQSKLQSPVSSGLHKGGGGPIVEKRMLKCPLGSQNVC